jgi:hypothetical protein
VNNAYAARILNLLAQGLDPSDPRACLSPQALSEPQVIRALFMGAMALQADHGVTIASRDLASPSMAGKPWTAEEDRYLLKAFDLGHSLEHISTVHRRTQRALAARLVRLGRINERSDVWMSANRSMPGGLAPEVRLGTSPAPASAASNASHTAQESA